MKKQLLGFWDIWNMSFGFLGIQFGFALQPSPQHSPILGQLPRISLYLRCKYK